MLFESDLAFHEKNDILSISITFDQKESTLSRKSTEREKRKNVKKKKKKPTLSVRSLQHNFGKERTTVVSLLA